MSKDSPSPPPAPDPVTTANAQSGSNISTAIANAQLNRVNQTTPWGSITYTQGAPGANGVPTWSSQIQLSPQQQALLDQQQGMQLQRNQIAQGYLGQVGRPLDLSNLHPIDMRGQMYTGAVNAAPAAGAQSGPPAQPAANSQQTSELINQILALLGGSGAAAAPPGGSPASPSAPGAAPSGAASPGAASPGTATPAPAQSALSFAPTYQDYLNYYGKGGDGALSEQQWNSLGSAGQWHALDDGFHIDQTDPRYPALAKQLGVTNGRMIVFGQGNAPLNAARVNGHTSFVDPTRVLQGDGVWATAHDNLTPQAEFSGGGMSDAQWAIAAASLLGGGALAGGALGGAAGAGAEGAGVGADVAGAAGSAGETGGLIGNAGMPGYAGAFDAEGASGLAGSAYDPLAAGTAGAASGAPVTDLSVQASHPGVLQQAGSNFMNGRGLLGLSPGQRAAVGLLPSLLRAMSARNGQGGGK